MAAIQKPPQPDNQYAFVYTEQIQPNNHPGLNLPPLMNHNYPPYPPSSLSQQQTSFQQRQQHLSSAAGLQQLPVQNANHEIVAASASLPQSAGQVHSMNQNILNQQQQMEGQQMIPLETNRLQNTIRSNKNGNKHKQFVDISAFCGIFGLGAFVIICGLLLTAITFIFQLVIDYSDLDLGFIAKAVFTGTSLILLIFFIYFASIRDSSAKRRSKNNHQPNVSSETQQSFRDFQSSPSYETALLPKQRVRSKLYWVSFLALAHLGVGIWLFILALDMETSCDTCSTSDGTECSNTLKSLKCGLAILNQIIVYGIISIGAVPFFILLLGCATTSQSHNK